MKKGFNKLTEVYEHDEVPDECPECGSEKFVNVSDFRFKPPVRFACQNCNFA